MQFDVWPPNRRHYSQWDAIRRKRWPNAKHFAYESFTSERVAFYDRHAGYCTIAKT